MSEKKTSNMLIRTIPIDVWERIDKLCRRKNLKRRDFIEQALRFLYDQSWLGKVLLHTIVKIPLFADPKSRT